MTIGIQKCLIEEKCALRKKYPATKGTIDPDGPSRMVKRPTESGGEPSSSNCRASAGVKARQPLLLHRSLAAVHS
jgi:hypothetical protein